MSATKLPDGNNAAEMIRRLRAIDAEIFGTLYAAAGVIGGDVEIQGDLIANDIYSENWEAGGGTVPLSLPDVSATTGYALQSATGVGQFSALYATGENITDLVAAQITVGQIATGQITNSAITEALLDDLAVTEAKVATNAITTAKIAADAVTAGELANLAVDTEHIQALAINAAKIDALAVTTAKLDTDAVTTAKIAAGAVDTTELALDAVTSGQLADLAVDTEHLQLLAVNAGIIDALAVTTAKIDTDAITTAKIAAGAVDTTELATDAVTSLKIEDNAVDTEHIVALAITAAEIDALAVTTAKIDTDAVTNLKIAPLAVDTAELAAGAVESTQLATDAVTTVKIATGAVDTNELAADAVDGTKLTDDAVDTEHINTGAIGTVELADDAVSYAKLDADAVHADNIQAGAVELAAFGTGLQPVQTVATLPGTASEGDMAFLTTDDKLYRYTGTAWTTAVPTVDLTGTIVEAQIGTGAVTGTKIGADAVDGTKLADNAIDTEHITAGAVDTAELAADAVDGTKLTDDAVNTEHITASAVGTTEITNDAITNDKIGDNAVDTLQIATGAVDTAELAADAVDGTKLVDNAINTEHITTNAVDTNELADAAVENTQLATNSISAIKIQTDAITAIKILADSITAVKILAGAVTADKILANAVTADKILAGAVTAGKILAGSIATDRMTVNTINGDRITINTLNAAKILTESITALQIAGGTITANEILAETITGVQIAGTTITGAHIVGETIEAAQIKTGTITANEIAGLTITASEIQANAITASKILVDDLAAVSGTMGALTVDSTLTMSASGTMKSSDFAFSDYFVQTGWAIGDDTAYAGTQAAFLSALIGDVRIPFEIPVGPPSPEGGELSITTDTTLGIGSDFTYEVSFGTEWGLGGIATPHMKLSGEWDTYLDSGFRTHFNQLVDILVPLEFSDYLRGPRATNVNTAYSFIGDNNTGMYSTGADVLSFAAGGANILQLTNDSVEPQVPIKVGTSGTAGAPMFTWENDDNTGMYRANPDVIGFATGGTIRLSLDSGGITAHGTLDMNGAIITNVNEVRGQLGSPTDATYTFTGDENTGMYSAGADRLSFARAGILRYDIVTTHSFYRHDNTLGFRVGASGASYLSRHYQSNGSTVALEVLPTNLKYLAQYSSTTSSSSNLYITSAGNFRRSTASSRRYKNRIKDVKMEGTLRPRSFHYNEGYVTDDPKGELERWYFIAEEVEEEFGAVAVEYDVDGQLEDVNFKAIIAILADKVNRLEEQVRELSK